MGWGQIGARCPRCKKLRRKVRDQRAGKRWETMDGRSVCPFCVAKLTTSPEAVASKDAPC